MRPGPGPALGFIKVGVEYRIGSCAFLKHKKPDKKFMLICQITKIWVDELKIEIKFSGTKFFLVCELNFVSVCMTEFLLFACVFMYMRVCSMICKVWVVCFKKITSFMPTYIYLHLLL